MHDRELFIGGRWRAAREGRRATIADPATGEPVGSTAIADAKDIDDAVAAAKGLAPTLDKNADVEWLILPRQRSFMEQLLDTGSLGPLTGARQLTHIIPELGAHGRSLETLLRLKSEPVWLLVINATVVGLRRRTPSSSPPFSIICMKRA